MTTDPNASGPPRCAAYVATSLDGFIARPDGGLDWLDAAAATVPEGEDCGYAEFMAAIDAIVMGRLTYETVRGFGDWPYGETPVHVLSRTLRRLPPDAAPPVSLHPGPPAALVATAARCGQRTLSVDGGATISAFLEARLLDEITITIIPVLLGSGRPLLRTPGADVRFRLVSSRSFPFGFVQNRYAITAGG